MCRNAHVLHNAPYDIQQRYHFAKVKGCFMQTYPVLQIFLDLGAELLPGG